MILRFETICRISRLKIWTWCSMISMARLLVLPITRPKTSTRLVNRSRLGKRFKERMLLLASVWTLGLREIAYQRGSVATAALTRTCDAVIFTRRISKICREVVLLTTQWAQWMRLLPNIRLSTTILYRRACDCETRTNDEKKNIFKKERW